MLVGVLKSDKAIKMSLKIVDTFIKIKHYINNNLLYHSGTSINYIELKTFSINIIEDQLLKESLLNKLKELID